MNVAWASILKTERDRALKDGVAMRNHERLKDGVFIDIAESHSRTPWGGIRALRQKSTLYSLQYDGILRAQHHLQVQGFPSNVVVGSLSEGLLKSLAGESFSVPCIASVIWALHTCKRAPWWQVDSKDSEGVDINRKDGTSG